MKPEDQEKRDQRREQLQWLAIIVAGIIGIGLLVYFYQPDRAPVCSGPARSSQGFSPLVSFGGCE